MWGDCRISKDGKSTDSPLIQANFTENCLNDGMEWDMLVSDKQIWGLNDTQKQQAWQHICKMGERPIIPPGD